MTLHPSVWLLGLLLPLTASVGRSQSVKNHDVVEHPSQEELEEGFPDHTFYLRNSFPIFTLYPHCRYHSLAFIMETGSKEILVIRSKSALLAGQERTLGPGVIVEIAIPPGKVRDFHLVSCNYDNLTRCRPGYSPEDW
jgi:hypothetical protein